MTAGEIWFLIVAGAISCFGFGYFCGESDGITDTERRWSDAVTRKEHYDAYAIRATHATGKYAVWHRVNKKNRRDAKKPCAGVAFYRVQRGPIPMNEIPATCLTCGQVLVSRQLDLHEVIDIAPTRPHVAERPRRHFRAKGIPVVEGDN